MALTATELSAKNHDPNDELQDTAFASRGCCCFWSFPCFNARPSNTWERISTSDREPLEITANRNWWDKGINAFKKIREWSELVAGPKWKTFIRRFNKTTGRSKSAKFQYDPFSYALNFDEGPVQNGQFEDEEYSRCFSARYAVIPGTNGQLKGEQGHT